MKNEDGWPRVHYAISIGQSVVGTALHVHLGRELNENDQRAISRAMRDLEQDLLAESTRLHPDNIAWKRRWLASAQSMFESAGLAPIYMREIDNKYCGPKCCPHRVWLHVTTRIGVIEIGWRKTVMHLDWGDTDVAMTADALFPNESVSKGDRWIHAWSYDKATEYLRKLGEQVIQLDPIGEAAVVLSDTGDVQTSTGSTRTVVLSLK